MLTAFSWVPKGAMKKTPIFSTDSVDQAREKLRRQNPDYVEALDEESTTKLTKRTKQGKPVGTPIADVVEEDNDDEDVVDDTLRDIAGAGTGTLIDQVESEDEDELDDITFKDTDLVFTVARADTQEPRLELCTYDEPEDNLFLHHDMQLSAFPLCSAWLTDGTMSMLAVGTMLPFIEVWALDVMDSVEPAAILGGCERVEHNYIRKGMQKHLKPDSHKEAVLSVQWNTIAQNILVSGSADHTIKLWDLNAHGGACLGTYQEPEKVQSLAWHATEANLLLSGGFDGNMVLRDCRQPDQAAIRFPVGQVIEHVEFVPTSSSGSAADNLVMASTSEAGWLAFDIRRASQHRQAHPSPASTGTPDVLPVWSLRPHTGEVVFNCSRQVPGLYATGGKDGHITLWDGRQAGLAPTPIVSRDYKTGAVLSLHFHPNSPHILGACGAAGEPLVYTITADVQPVFQQQQR